MALTAIPKLQKRRLLIALQARRTPKLMAALMTASKMVRGGGEALGTQAQAGTLMGSWDLCEDPWTSPG
jgi:hypothetical protein